MTVRRAKIKSKRSKKRQNRRLKTTIIFIIVVVAFIMGGISWAFHNENILIDSIQIKGAQSVDTEEVMKLAEENISGYRLWIFPKKNILIFPKNKLRVEILDKYKQIKNVVIKRDGFKAMVITISEREPFALWCDGEAPVNKEFADVGDCYFVDNWGYIYASAPYFHDHVYFELYGKSFLEVAEVTEETKEDEDVDKEKVIKNNEENSANEIVEVKTETKEKELNAKITSDAEYIGKHFLPPSEFVRTMQFVSSLEKIDLPTHSLVIADSGLYELSLRSGGMLRFLPTQDYHRAINDLTTAYEKKFSKNFDLLPKDIEYIDIRFDNKVLFKFKN